MCVGTNQQHKRHDAADAAEVRARVVGPGGLAGAAQLQQRRADVRRRRAVGSPLVAAVLSHSALSPQAREMDIQGELCAK